MKKYKFIRCYSSVMFTNVVLFLFYSCGINPSVKECSVPLAINTEDVRNLEVLNDIIFHYEDALKNISIDAGPKRAEKSDDMDSMHGNQFFYTCPSYIYQVVSAKDSIAFKKACQALDKSFSEKDRDAYLGSINFQPNDSIILYEFLCRRCSGENEKVYVYHQLQFNPKQVMQGKEKEIIILNENWQYLISIEEDLSGYFP